MGLALFPYPPFLGDSDGPKKYSQANCTTLPKTHMDPMDGRAATQPQLPARTELFQTRSYIHKNHKSTKPPQSTKDQSTLHLPLPNHPCFPLPTPRLIRRRPRKRPRSPETRRSRGGTQAGLVLCIRAEARKEHHPQSCRVVEAMAIAMTVTKKLRVTVTGGCLGARTLRVRSKGATNETPGITSNKKLLVNKRTKNDSCEEKLVCTCCEHHHYGLITDCP